MPPTDCSRAKIRPQQSCLKCRERKVKCDRRVPCHACIVRGLETQCTYMTTAEDRAQISQAETIERLRREVAQLQAQLEQGLSKEMGRGSTAVPVDAAEMSSSSWCGSSPSSSASTSTMTSSRTVTSPESSGSESGGSVVHYPPHTHRAESGELLNTPTLSKGDTIHCSMPVYRTESPDYTHHYTEADLRASQDGPDAHHYHHHHQWSPEAYGQQHHTACQSHTDAPPYSSTTTTFPNTNPGAGVSSPHLMNSVPLASHSDTGHTTHPDKLAPNDSDILATKNNTPIPNSSAWKGKSKQELLETLLETIGSCDEQCVAQVVQVVRTSPTPEEAVTEICRILGIRG